MTSAWKNLSQALARVEDDAKCWEDVCNQIVDVMGAKGVIFAPVNPNFRGQWMSCSTSLKSTLAEYLGGGWHLNDTREGVTQLMLKNGYATDSEIFPDRAKKYELPIYKEFLCKHDFGMLTALKILTPNGYWGCMLHFSNDHIGICEKQIEKLGKLRSLLEEATVKAYENSLKKIADFAQFFSESESEVSILDGHGDQTLRIDRFGKLKATNSKESLLPPSIKSQMEDELTILCSSDPDLSLSTSYQFKDGKDYITVLVIQIPISLRHFFMPFKVCAIRTLCSDTMVLKQSVLSRDFGLTTSEISTLELLSTGKSPKDISELLGLKPSSIRQRLKTVYGKTDVNSQVALVALYNSL